MYDEEYRVIVDTAGSIDGPWPAPGPGAYVVSILTPYDWQNVQVSDRYTAPCDATEAAILAVDAYHEIEGHTVPRPNTFGGPFYHVRVYPGGQDEPTARGIVRADELGDWQYKSEV